MLGPVQLSQDGTPVQVRASLQLQVLAQLVAARGRRVGDDLLVSCLWPEEPPPGAMDNLRALVSRLRAALDPSRQGLIEREHGGYRLPRELVTVDADAVEQTLAAGGPQPPERRLALLEEALGRFQGEPYAGLPALGPVGVERVRLAGLLASWRGERLSIMVDHGRTAAAVPELEALTAEEPTDEGSWELLALALYRDGQQARALGALREARRLLLEEHGLDPGPRLRRLETAILEQDPSLDATPPEAAGPPVPASGADGADSADSADGVDDTSVPASGAGQPLPRPLTSFVGRGPEREELRALVTDHRLVTLVGIGGSGKTRLAIEVAGDLGGGPAGPVRFADLGALRDAALLGEALAAAVGVLPTGDDGLLQALADRSVLLVVDNCEHLLEPVATLLERVLQRCPGVRVLATSRLPLGVEGERLINLPPLDPASDGVELFRQRASAVGADPSSLQDAAAMERICRGLDGLPLALELAAGQCRLLSVHQVAEALDEDFDLMEQLPGRRARRDRGESLGAVVAWSVERLTPAARRTFEQVSVFAGSFDLAAARAVCEDRALIGSLLELLDAGLLVATDTPEGRRYRVLEPLRAWAERHGDAAVRGRAAQAHTGWVTALLDAAAPELHGARAQQWFVRLEREQPNLRAALARVAEAGDGALLRRLTGALGWFWYRRGHVAEGLRWSTEALALPATPSDDGHDTARSELGAGLLHYLGGNAEPLMALGQAAAATARESGDAQTEALATSFLAYFLAYTGDVSAARASIARAEEVASADAPPWTLADVLMIRGQLLRALGEPEAALATLDEATAVAERHHHGWAAASSQWIAGKVALDVGRPEEAVRRALGASRDQNAEGDVTSWLVSLHLLAGAVALVGRPEVGARLLGAVDGRGARLGFSPAAMDPLDSPRHVAAVTDALPPDRVEELMAEGAALDDDALVGLLDELSASVDAHAPT